MSRRADAYPLHPVLMYHPIKEDVPNPIVRRYRSEEVFDHDVVECPDCDWGAVRPSSWTHEAVEEYVRHYKLEHSNWSA
jgi:hypothetical protein